MAYNGVVCMMDTSEEFFEKFEKFGEGNGRSSEGEGMNPHFIAHETIRSISYLSNFSAETKAIPSPFSDCWISISFRLQAFNLIQYSVYAYM